MVRNCALQKPLAAFLPPDCGDHGGKSENLSTKCFGFRRRLSILSFPVCSGPSLLLLLRLPFLPLLSPTPEIVQGFTQLWKIELSLRHLTLFLSFTKVGGHLKNSLHSNKLGSHSLTRPALWYLDWGLFLTMPSPLIWPRRPLFLRLRRV